MIWIAGNGEELVSFNTALEAREWMLDQLEGGFGEADLVLFTAEPVNFAVKFEPMIIVEAQE